MNDRAESILTDLLLNVAPISRNPRAVSVAYQEHIAPNNMRSARRFIFDGGKTAVELTEYGPNKANNIPGGPDDATVFARLTESGWKEIACWIEHQESLWLDRNNK